MSSSSGTAPRRPGALQRWLLLEAGETLPFALAFVYFFCLIGSYMMLRPVRETLAVRAGDTEWLFSSVFLVMLLVLPIFGWLVGRFPRRVFIPACSVFFLACLLGFAVWLDARPQSLWAGRVFFVWLSVYNLFVVSLFWSMMVDVFTPAAARRLFGPIAAGGSLGGLAGPLVSILQVDALGAGGLIAVACALLLLALACQLALLPRLSGGVRGAPPLGGSIWAGARALVRDPYLRGIALVLVFLPLSNTFLYFIQRDMVAAAFATDAARLKWFGMVDLGAQLTSLLLQFALTARLLRWIGVAWCLLALPAFTMAGFVALSVAPGVLLLGAFQALRRGGEYGLMKPARELLFTAVDEEDKYKTKNFIDTAVYRGGDMGSGWLYRGLSEALGLAPAAIAALAVPAAGLWAWVAYVMGRRFERSLAADRAGRRT